MGTVWVAGGWRVESVRLDRGTGLWAWIEVRRDADRRYCLSTAALQEEKVQVARRIVMAEQQDHLYRHGVDLSDLIPADEPPPVRDPRDGCE